MFCLGYFNDEINHHPLPSISQAMDKKIQRRNTDSHFKMPPSYDSLQEPNASLPNLHRPTSSSITIKPLGRLTEEFDSVKSTYKSPKVKKASLVNEDAIPLSSLPVDKERADTCCGTSCMVPDTCDTCYPVPVIPRT